MIASHCHNLTGLDISGISTLESQIQLWEILSDMKLTHLAVDFCVISPLSGDVVLKKTLVFLFQKCSSLIALEYWCKSSICGNCKKAPVENCSLLSHFPSLQYCKIARHYSTSIQDIITSCKKLKYCILCEVPTMNCPPLILSTSHSVTLQQLYIDSPDTIAPDTFMSSISAHGRLVHVFLSVASVSVVGISVLIENSPKLMTFQLKYLELCNVYNVKLSILEFSKYEIILKQKFPHRKLFHRGGYKMLQRSACRKKSSLLDISFMEQTDVYYLFDAVYGI